MYRLGSSNSVPIPHPEKVDVIDLTEGSKFNSSCGLVINPKVQMIACVTKNVSTTFEDISGSSSALSDGVCAACSGSDTGSKCAMQFNSSLTGISVSRLIGDDCPQTQLLDFVKENVSLDDDGTKIMCAYAAVNEVRSFHSIYLNVSPLSSNRSSLVAALSSTFSILLLAVIIAALVCIVSRRAKKYRGESRSMIIGMPFRLYHCMADSNNVSLSVPGE